MACGAEMPGAGAVWQRRTITVVFADLVGFTTIGEELDSESLAALLGSYYQEARRIVHRHGGSLEKFIGDAVVAVFGYHVAHEDDALRAVRAASDLRALIPRLDGAARERYGVPISLRIGVNTGAVTLTAGDSTSSTILGDSMNTAARLQQNAAPGEVLLGSRTFQLVRDHVVVEAVAPMTVKGKSEPVDTVRLVSVTRPGDAGRDGVFSPFVGRRAEMSALLAAFDGVVLGRPAMVTIIGEPGIGKSSLFRQFLAMTDGQARVLRGRCLPYGEGITYWPLGEIMRREAGINETDAPVAAIDKLRSLAAGATPLAALDTIGSAIGLVPAPTSASSIADAFVEIIAGWAAAQPVIVLFEDVHWAERTLLDLVEHVASTLADVPVLLLCAARPELLEARASWPGSGARIDHTEVRLGPLDPADSTALLGTRLDGARLERPLEDRLVELAGGNPLFLEQIASMLLEEGLVERIGDELVATPQLVHSVPATVHALLTARIDRLTPQDASLLCHASVVGVEFDLDDLHVLLPTIDGAALAEMADHLVKRDFLEGRGPSGSYRFRHVLVRDVAYERLTKDDRSRLHIAAAEHIQLRALGRLAEYDEIIGYHLEQGWRYRNELRQTTPADLDLAHRAAAHLAEAGRRASRRGDTGAAMNLLGRAAELLPPGHPARTRVVVHLGEALMDAGRMTDADRLFSELDHAEGVDEVSQTHIEMCRGQLELQQLPSTAAVMELHRRASDAMELLAIAGDESALLRACWLSYLTSMTVGRSTAARGAIDRLSGVAGRLSQPVAGRLPGMLAMNLAWGPTPAADALTEIERILASVRNDPAAEPFVLAHHAYVLAQLADVDAARQALARMREIAERRGQRILLWSSWGQNMGRVELLAGEAERAERAMLPCYSALRDVGERGFAGTIAGQLAHALVELGRYEEAASFATAGRDLAGEADVLSQILWRSALARVAARAGSGAEAVELAQEAVSLADTTEWPNVAADALLDHARVLARLGEPAGAACEQAAARFRKKGNLAGLAKVAALTSGRA